MRVFVLYTNKQPAMPCTPKRARLLLTHGKAAVYRRTPFTIILKHCSGGETQPIAMKIDPGSKTTGLALVTDGTVIFGANLEHRGEIIKLRLTARRNVRGQRRSRKTRYRAKRYDNRSRPKGWLPPSIQSRINNIFVWTKKLVSLAPITEIEFERVRFDTQLMQDATIAGIGYQQGTLYGYEIREYLLNKFGPACVYCDNNSVPLEIDHVRPRSRGGSNRISNLALACHRCNEAKANHDVRNFVTDPTRLAKILAGLKMPLNDVAAVNSTRNAIEPALSVLGIPISGWSGGRTKMNRTIQGYSKDHWIDAACVGESGAAVAIPTKMKPLRVKAIGRGHRQTVRTDSYGFPRAECAKLSKRRDGFSAGDIVEATISRGKRTGTFIARIAAANRNRFDIVTQVGKIGTSAKTFRLIQRLDGYAYAA